MAEAQAQHSTVVEPGVGRRIDLGGTVVTLRLDGSATGEAYAAMNIALAPGAGAALHRHRYEDETFAILSGVITFQLGAETRAVGSGGLVFIPGGLLHAFRNDGTEHATALIVVTPAGLEQYFAELGALLGAAEQPAAETIAALNERYGLEFIPG